jgi:anti-sigma28 factor (negative regulator of flagellin synthesis)
MKVKDLIALLNTRDQDSDVYILTKDGREQVGRITSGKFFNTIDLATKVNLTVDQAEQSLYQLATYDQLTSETEEDISAVIGKERVEAIKTEIKAFQEEMRKARTQMDSQDIFSEETLDITE